MDEDESEWEQINAKNWRGLGLTDPIKSVEVRLLVSCILLSIESDTRTRTNGFFYQLS